MTVLSDVLSGGGRWGSWNVAWVSNEGDGPFIFISGVFAWGWGLGTTGERTVPHTARLYTAITPELDFPHYKTLA